MSSMRINLFDCPIDALTLDQTIQKIDDAIRQKKHIHHVFVNVATIVHLQDDPVLKRGVVNCDIINADGLGVVWAANALGLHIPERVSGPDLMEKIVELSHHKGYKIYFLGAEEWVVKKVTEVYAEKYSPDIIAGYHHGYFTAEDEPALAQMIAATKPNILFVAMTSPKKEDFLYRNKSIFSEINMITGVGGCFDLVAGKTKRAPKWMQKVGLEWFYRMIQEPRRLFGRYLTTNAAMAKMIIFRKLKLNRK